MADSSLDDFFAKKDRSKRSKTKKFTTTDQIARNLEEGGKRSEKPMKKDKEKNTNSSSSGVTGYMQNTDQEEDEWKEVEEKETDYSGLKIQNLQISELRDDDLEKEKSDDYSEDFDQQGQRDGSGPWNKGAAPPPVAAVEVIPDEKPRKYVAPHMSSSGSASKSRMKAAPEIDSELHFPSLSASADGRKKGERSPDSEKGFESVKRGGTWTVDDTSNRSPQLNLGNKYDLLSRGETS